MLVNPLVSWIWIGSVVFLLGGLLAFLEEKGILPGRQATVLEVLPFVEMVGNALTYNRENAMATAAFFDVDKTILAENSGTLYLDLARSSGGEPDRKEIMPVMPSSA